MAIRTATAATAALALTLACLFVQVPEVSADSTPPLFYGGFPRTGEVRDTSIVIETQTNEASTIYYMIVLQGETPAPTTALVKQIATSGQGDYSGVAVKSSGTFTSTGSQVTTSAKAIGLSGGIVYDIYVVAEDLAGNIQSMPTRVDERTADEAAPTYASGYPLFAKIAGTRFDIRVQLNEIGRVYYVMQEQGSPAPTSEEVMAGQGNGGSNALACGVIEVTIIHPHHTDHSHYNFTTVINSDDDCVHDDTNSFYGADFYGLNQTGLPSALTTCTRCPKFNNGTTYDVWFVTEDDESLVTYYRTNNYQAVPNLVTIYTGDFRVPVYNPGYPEIQNLEASAPNFRDLDVAVAMDEVGTAYFYMVYANVTKPPTSLQVKSQHASYIGNSPSDVISVVDKGTFAIPSAYNQFQYHVSGFTDETYYHVYVVIEDTGNNSTLTNIYITDDPNYQVEPNLLVFYAPDGTPPVWVGPVNGLPTTANVYGTYFDIVVQMDEIAEAYYVVVLNGSPHPSLEDLKLLAGKDGEGALACGIIDVTASYLNMTGTVEGILNPDTEPACHDSFYGLEGLGNAQQFCSRCPIIDSETTYDIYLLAKDDDDNWQLAYFMMNVTTPDITPPKFINGHPRITANDFAKYDYQPNAGGVLLNLTTSIDERGRAYYVVVLDEDDAPTSKQVRAGVDYDGNKVWKAGYINLLDSQTYVTVSIIGLQSETQFNVWVVAEDDEDLMPPYPGQPVRAANLQHHPTPVPVFTADISYPIFATGYPNIPYADLAGTQLNVQTKINEPGFVYYVIVLANWTYHKTYTDGTARMLPTPEEVKAGTGPGGMGQIVAGVIANPMSNQTVVTTIAGLESQTLYDIYFVAIDDEHSGDNPPNLQPFVTKIHFQTRDITPPEFQAGFPAVRIGGESLDVIVRLNELGKYYYIVVLADSLAPTAAQVFAGVNYPSQYEDSGFVTPHAVCTLVVDEVGVDKICTVNTLISETMYDVHVVAEDNTNDSITLGQSLTPNQMTTISSVTFRTRDITPPELLEGTPYVTDLLGTQVDINIEMYEEGMAFYTILPDYAPPPTAQQVKVGIGADMLTLPQSHGNISIPVKRQMFTGTALGLISEHDYLIHVTAQDDGAMDLGPDDDPNLRWQTDTVFIRTPDITPPSWEGYWSKNGTIENVGGTHFEIVVQLNEIGTVYYIVVPFGSPVPSNLDVKTMDDSNLEVACGVIDIDEQFMNKTGPVMTVNLELHPECAGDESFYGLGDAMQDRYKGLDDPVAGFYGLDGLGTDDSKRPYCSRCPKIRSETAYDVYIVAEDDGGHGIPSDVALDNKNLQLLSQKINRVNYPWYLASVITADITPPEFVSSTPYGIKFQGSGFDLVVALNEPGKVFYCVVPIASTGVDPSRVQIKKGQDGYNDWCPAYGEIEVPEANVEVITTVLGLGNITREEDRYFVYVYAEDDEPTGMTMFTSPNEGPVQDPLMIETVDVMAPLYKSGYPILDLPVSTTGYGAVITTFRVLAALDEPGRTYYVAFLPTEVGTVHPGAYAPTSEQVKNCQDYMGNPAAVCGTFANPPDGIVTTHILTDRTTYDVYIVSEDDTEVFSGGLRQRGPNLQSAPVKRTITTADGRAPLFTYNPCNSVNITYCTSNLESYIGAHSPWPYTDATYETNTTIVAAISEPGRVYYMIVAAADADPTLQQVVAGVAYTDFKGSVGTVAPLKAGYIDCPTANTTCTESVTGLDGTTPYFVYVATWNAATNIGDGDVLRTFRQNPTKMVPTLITKYDQHQEQYSNVTINVLENVAYPRVTLSAPAVLYYVLLRQGAPAPNVTQVRYNVDAFNMTAPDIRDAGGDFADNSRSDASGTYNITTAYQEHTFATIANLTRKTYYDLYVVLMHTDAFDAKAPDHLNSLTQENQLYDEFSRSVTKFTFRTQDLTPPFYTPGYPNITHTNGYNLTLAVHMDEPGKSYYIVLPGGSLAPDSYDVRGCKVVQGVTPLKCGTIEMPRITNTKYYKQYETMITGLTPETIYDVWVVAQDDEGAPTYGGTNYTLGAVNLQALPTKLPVITTSVDARLSNLTVSVGTLQPPFNPFFSQYKSYPYPDNYHYTLFLTDGTSSVTITPTAMNDESIDRITINGTLVKSLTGFTVNNLVYGKTLLPIQVHAGDDQTIVNYNLTITRVADPMTYNATLERLYVQLDNGVRLNATDLGARVWPYCVFGCTADSPAMCTGANPSCVMDANQTEYIAYIPQGVKTIKVQPYATSPNSNIKMYTLGTSGVEYPGGLPGYTTGVNPATHPTVNLFVLYENGGNTIDLVVTAANGDQLTYTITVKQHGPGVYPADAWKPVVPTTAELGVRYGPNYGTDDDLTTFVALNPTLPRLNVIPDLDISPPLWLDTFPRLANVSTSSVDLVLQTDEPSRVYYLFTAVGARTPTSREVMQPFLRTDRVTNGTALAEYSLTQEISHKVTGLSTSTTYDIYLVAEDAALDFSVEYARNHQTTPTKLTVTTS